MPKLTVPLDNLVKNSKMKVPCGGCQWMGCDPDIENGICTNCNRDENQIMKDHGKVKLTDIEKDQRKEAVFYHMTGGCDISYTYES